LVGRTPSQIGDCRLIHYNSRMCRYRIYVDESGDHTYSQLNDPANRYLALMGIAIEQGYYRETYHPEFEALKQEQFPHNPDDPVVLVRSQIIGRRGPFGRLSDPQRNAAWEKAFLNFLAKVQVVLFSVVIDKRDHLSRYGDAAHHPYNYCMTVMLERVRGFLHYTGGRADVMAESRGTREDRELQQVYDMVWNRGTFYISAQAFRNVFTSNHIKFRKKEHNIAGLQLADLLAAPSKIDILADHNRIMGSPPSKFTVKINRKIRRRYSRYGRVFLD